MLCGVLLLWVVAAAAAPRVEVRLEGVSGQIGAAIFSNLSLQREHDHPLLTESRIQRLSELAPGEIREALRPFGYYKPVIHSELTHEGENFIATYVIDPGRPVRIGTVEVSIQGEGEADPNFRRWRKEFPLHKGDILLDQVYEEAKERLLRIGRERGYLDARLVEHEIRVNVAESRADIILRYQTGPRFKFGEVHYSEVPLRPSLIRRFADFKEGEPYDAEKVYRLHRDLSLSDYFERVDVVPRTDSPHNGEIPIDVGLQMRKRNRYTAGVGYGTDTGPRITLGMERRWVNSYGHRFSGEIVASEVRQSVTGSYRIPLTHPTTDFLGFNGSREHEKTSSTVRDTSTVSSNVTHQIGPWLRTVALNYQEENFEVGDSPSTRSTMLYPGLSVQRSEADDRIFPTRGWRVYADGRIAGEDFWSSSSLLQGRISGKAIFPLLYGRFITRFDLAGSYASKFDKLPVSLRYFAGGDQSVRGFAYQSLGPKDSTGAVIGGTDLLVGSVEYDHYLSPRFGLAIFTDMGNAFSSFSNYQLHQGTGVGLRFKFPFGVLRVDAASAVSEPGKPWRLHLTIGPDL